MPASVKPIFRFLAVFAAPAVAIKAAIAHRRLVRHLAGFDDHMLRDIGLTRSDVHSAMAESMFGDPTVRLSTLAYEARTGRQANARDERRWARMIADTDSHAAAEIDRRAA